MNIKKVDDKLMVIHTKEKSKLKVKGAPETKIKGSYAYDCDGNISRLETKTENTVLLSFSTSMTGTETAQSRQEHRD